MINMAGGVPHPDTFPILQLQAKVKPLGSGNEGKRPRDTIVLNKSQRCQSTESLDELLQYGAGCGVESYCNFLQKYTQLVHRPKYSDWGVISSCGNTDAIGKAVSLFCEAGDSILVEKWTFPGALGSFAAAKVLPVPVDMDGEGMDPDSLDRICTSWGEAHPLRALYLVPTGQNPTGATMSFERRQKIYSVARKHNLAIIEDDPYYFLQLAPYSIGESSSINKVMMAELDVQQADALVPSLLSLDVDGRVIRLDSFSKVLAPNLRCGWITAPTYILDKLQILNESTILQPSGLTQGVISKLLNDTWGIDGWNRHLCELRAVYTYRRNMFVCMVDRYLSGLVEYVVPSAGMFLWMKINLGS
ncbi:pyridoxal phosphate-dependent transferase, partial [Coemansia spiralis]